VDAIFTRAQARASGYSAYQIRRRIAAGEWLPVLGPVLAERGRPLTVRLRDRAATLAVPGSLLAAASAARQWGIDVPDRRQYLWVGRRRPEPLPGVRYLRDPLQRIDISTQDGLRLTAPGRTVFDCVRFLADEPAQRLLDRALQVGWLSAEDFAARVIAHAGRRGAPRLARLSRAAGSGARSAAERRAAELLRRARIHGWQANRPITDQGRLIGIGDLVFESARLVVEIDGRAYHVTPERFEHDRRRQNRLMAAGWTVLRFTWRDLTERQWYVIGTIESMLNNR